MAVPKRKLSRSRTRRRRAQWTASAPELVPVRNPSGETVHVPARLATAVRRGLI